MDKRLATILAGVFGLKEAQVHPGLQKADVGTWDSLKQMDLVLSLENTYGIALEITDIVRMTSVEAIVEVLQTKGVNLGS